MKSNLIPLILNKQDIPVVLWSMDTATVVILHGTRQQLVTQIMFDGVERFSCPRTATCPERKQIRQYEQPIYNRNGKPVATYNRHNGHLTVWHEGHTTIIFLPAHTGMRWENTVE